MAELPGQGALGIKIARAEFPNLAGMKGKLVKPLMPVFQIDNKSCAMLTPQLAGIERKRIGPEVVNVSGKRNEIIAALDLLLTGIYSGSLALFTICMATGGRSPWQWRYNQQGISGTK